MRTDPFRRGSLALVFLIAVWPARADDEANHSLRAAIGRLAARIETHLASRKEKSIVVGHFVGPEQLHTQAGPGIQAALAEALEARKIEPADEAPLTVRGSYSLARDPLNPDLRIFRLTAEFTDPEGNKLTELDIGPVSVRGEADLAGLFAPTLSLPPTADERKRNLRLQDHLSKPRFYADVAQVRSEQDSPYAIEILVDGKGLTPEERKGLAFVHIPRGESYKVRLVNQSDHDAAVALTIDGLSAFAFSELRDRAKRPLYTHFLVPKQGSTIIPGWHRTNDRSDAFVVTRYSDSAAGKLKQVGPIGTISAAFCAAWTEDDRPPDEPARPKSIESDATGRGVTVDKKYQEVRRSLGVVRAVLSVRYTRETP